MDDELEQIREKRRQELMGRVEHPKPKGVIHIDQNQLAGIMQNNPRLVIDFWAEWCGPCKRVAPAIEELAQEFAGKVTFGKCNTDENQQLAMQLNISAIPTIMLFSDGQLADRIIGAYPKEAIREHVIRAFGIDEIE